MSTANTILALTLIDSLLTRAANVNVAILTARKEGRDVSEAELASAASADDLARVKLETDIAKAKAEGR